MDITKFKELKMSLIQVRRSLDVGVYDNEELYPLDTFRYKPEIIYDLIMEVEEVIINDKNRKTDD